MLSQNHPFIGQRDYGRLLLAMRKAIREEFSVDIRLTEEDIQKKLLSYALSSENYSLREMGKELEELVTAGVDGGNNAEEVTRSYYRGAAVVGHERLEREKVAETVKKPRVYRGCTIR